jgi:hypothetical protein
VEVARTHWVVSTTPPKDQKSPSITPLESSQHLFSIRAALGGFGVVVYYDHAFFFSPLPLEIHVGH